MLAVFWAIQHLKLYLLGTNIILKTDNKPLVSILSSKTKDTSARLERLRLKILEYDYEVAHTIGSTNLSDFMSRNPILLAKNKIVEQVEEDINEIIQLNLPKTITRKEIVTHTIKDSELSQVKKALMNNLDVDDNYKVFKNELSITGDGNLERKNKIMIPESLKKVS